MQVKATAKSLRISPRKMGLVAALVRSRSVSDAITILEHTPKKSAGLLLQVVKSAVANAESNQNLKSENLSLASVLVSPGIVFKRHRIGSHGHVDPIKHRTTNVTVIIEGRVNGAADKEEAKKRVSTKPNPKSRKPAVAKGVS